MKSLMKNQSGLSLVELLIAMALGLILTLGALQMMLSSQSLYRTTDSLSRIQESGRFALDFLAKDIRMAGYNSLNLVSLYDEACGTFTSCTDDGGGSTSDRIGIMLQPSQAVDCIGNTLTDSVVVNVYYLQAVAGVSSLYCRGYNPTTSSWLGAEQPLIDGVENMQILYGIKTVDADGEFLAVNNYIPASAAVSYENVATVRIALLVNNGQANGDGDLATRTFTLLNAPQLSFNDKHQRQIYTSTIAINNAIYTKN